MISYWLLLLLISIAVVALFRFHWRRRHMYLLANKLQGPRALPIIGNALQFSGNTKDILKTINTISSRFPKPIRFWFGPKLVLYFTDPRHIEKILSSSKMAYKHDVYEQIFKIYLGDGLITNSGPKYKKHRRLIQPLINVKFVTGNLRLFQKHIDVMLKKLDAHANGKDFDIHDLIHYCFTDIIGESILGTHIQAQHGKNVDYVHATSIMYENCYSRMMRPWLHPDMTYYMTKGKERQTYVVNTTTAYAKKIIENAWKRISSDQYEVKDTSPIIDQIVDVIRKDPSSINKEDLLHHMYTLYIASEDTMTIITSFLCMCLGMYPEYQILAAEEIRSIFGETPRSVTYDDIIKMQYLDMCIKEILRLIPIAPIIIRKTIEDFQIDNLTIPKNCGVMVSIFDVHRDPNYWENPKHFFPNHFLPEKVTRRHPFAFVPFSAGPRGCVGKLLAMIGLKLMIAKILQEFEIEADGKFPDVVLKADISVRSAEGYNVRLKPRIWP